MITPSGVRTASATQSMVLCVTAINSTSNGPISTLRPGRTSRSVVDASRPRFFQPLFYQRESEARAVHRHVQVAKNVRQRADVIFVSVRQDNRAHLRAVLL